MQLAEKQVVFGSVPLNMPSVRTAVLHNIGSNHAYYQVPTHTNTHPRFCTDTSTHKTRLTAILSLCCVFICLRQVLDVCPLPGMMVSPPEGVVPSGGQAALHIHFNPDSIFRFDTRVEVRDEQRRAGSLFYVMAICVCVHVCVYKKILSKM